LLNRLLEVQRKQKIKVGRRERWEETRKGRRNEGGRDKERKFHAF
jgi:hypothetical protein